MDRPDVTEPGVTILQGDALNLDLPDNSVDLIVTSPPYFGLRSYQDGGEHYDGQIGAEATPAEFVDALIAATQEMMRVVKPTGSIWVNLGDKYSRGSRPRNQPDQFRDGPGATFNDVRYVKDTAPENTGVPGKSLIGIPWRYAIRCIDDLGLILRAEVIWSKPNGLPESVTDRVRRSHEHWFHFTLNPRYYSAVDEVREPHVATVTGRDTSGWRTGPSGQNRGTDVGRRHDDGGRVADFATSPLGKLPGSVWTIATEPLRVPEELGIDHFAAFPTEWPRRIITGWSPRGVCVECGEGRRPVVDRETTNAGGARNRPTLGHVTAHPTQRDGREGARRALTSTITGEACDCPEPTAPTTPGVILDPFGGTGTTALVAHALDRHGISVDMSSDYCRLARWRTSDPKQQAKAARWRTPRPNQQTKTARREPKPPTEQVPGQVELDFGEATP